MSMLSKCETCGHNKLAHLDNERPTGTGACHHGGLGEECQCPKYVCDSEGSDIRDVSGETADAGESTVRNDREGEYDASSDSIISGEKLDRLKAEMKIASASRILLVDQGNDSAFPDGEYKVAGEQGVMTAEEMANFLTMRDQTIKEPPPINGNLVVNGDVWAPGGSEPMYALDGSWVSFEDYERAQKSQQDDPVNHPSHYTAYPGIEIIQLTRWMNFNLGNCVKYVTRAGKKDPDKELEDLEKAKWYLEDEIKRLKQVKDGSMGTDT